MHICIYTHIKWERGSAQLYINQVKWSILVGLLHQSRYVDVLQLTSLKFDYEVSWPNSLYLYDIIIASTEYLPSTRIVYYSIYSILITFLISYPLCKQSYIYIYIAYKLLTALMIELINGILFHPRLPVTHILTSLYMSVCGKSFYILLIRTSDILRNIHDSSN